MSILIEEKYLNELREIVIANVDISKWQPVVFGSRIKGTARKYSDIDLGFKGSAPMPISTVAKLWNALDDSDIPYVVDIVDLSLVNIEFLKEAQSGMENLLA
ncbi:MAG: nucleotidyltransferase domain-containing protein [Acidimicrobiales bacterium]|nr:nucleotidyltransferase domain-containing protein [Acidimicrobiales bacterium]